MRLGDFDALKIKLDAELMDISDYLNIHEQIKDIIDNAPIIIMCDKTSDGLPLMDLRPRPKGEWITGGKDVTGQYFYDEFICNQCFVVVDNKSNFCPRCGAKMEKGGVEK